MAGALVTMATEHSDKSMAAIRDEWEIQFSRFFNNPALSSTCSSSTIHPDLIRKTRSLRRGTWISSSSASLQLLTDHSTSQAILIVRSGGRIHEEHFISKLLFSWPQVSCVSGFPARGSRVVFVSYKDCVSQVQKFALRFSTIYETERFINALKDILKDVEDIELLSSGFVTEVSSQSEISEELSVPVHSHCSLLPPSSNHEVEQHSRSQETAVNHNCEGTFVDMPPSFTSLLTNCCFETQAAAQPTITEEMDLKSQIARYMEDSSFQDMLFKVEKVISEMGDDLML
ncbi:protein POOR HOMOLOGOUS SYNAPSIS 1 isoform X2 [Vitis vinifera]|uniref:protein POOR HOMOLOGOUS SYNAPSIS 1 isoform X2 n=1 Tax=Vitis vinifera TaxID=29760 RepID=UPI0028830650|nr:protein POOR HOMOLOGOUS SYNAPSIS 1 isoform X2 [Vitis vinifera]